MISAGFQIPGNVEDEREALMIDVTKGSMMGRQSRFHKFTYLLR